jgi:hypothetical protein
MDWKHHKWHSCYLFGGCWWLLHNKSMFLQPRIMQRNTSFKQQTDLWTSKLGKHRLSARRLVINFWPVKTFLCLSFSFLQHDDMVFEFLQWYPILDQVLLWIILDHKILDRKTYLDGSFWIDKSALVFSWKTIPSLLLDHSGYMFALHILGLAFWKKQDNNMTIWIYIYIHMWYVILL